MKFLQTTKDGGPKSHVWAHWLIEIKGLFSIVLLRFEDGSREAYHSHAFNCFSWVLSGCLREHHATGAVERHRRSWIPFVTRRRTFHQVHSTGRTWVLSFRGPWADTWQEITESGKRVTLTHGRKVVG